ncbi:MAG: hypothetical protein PHP42_14130 [Bacteroidota bacterium]|nr:hypothetical protein [Bacteroidota bacterium]
MKKIFGSLVVGMFFLTNLTLGQTSPSVFKELKFGEKNLGGPRLGVTSVIGNGQLVYDLKQKHIGRFISQFGWHFEYQVQPEGDRPSFVIQFVPLVAGVEYGYLVPSASLAMGIRLPSGFEFGMGPNAIVTPTKISTALVVAGGYVLDYGGVLIPLNIALATNQDGNRLSFVFGYSITKSSK